MSIDLGQEMQQLYQQFGELPGVSIELHRELLAVSVENTQASATIFLQGAQLSHYQKRGEPETIWCSPDGDYSSATPLRGGIPVCWPWFSNLANNPERLKNAIIPLGHKGEFPAHGFVRNRHWQLKAVDNINEGLTRVQLHLSLAKDEEPFWPWATELDLVILIGDTLQLTLEVHNCSNQTVLFSGALHSYFAVSEIENISVDGLDGLGYIDCMDNWQQHKQQGPLVIDTEVDRIYSGQGSRQSGMVISLDDQQWQRKITITSEGSNSAVLWNPWTEKSRRLPHFADDAYQTMLCIETANADKDAVELPAGEIHQLTLTIDSKNLTDE